MEQKKIDRISELTAISRTRELTAAEQSERKALRQEYVASLRENLESQLNSTYILHDDGRREKLHKKTKNN